MAIDRVKGVPSEMPSRKKAQGKARKAAKAKKEAEEGEVREDEMLSSIQVQEGMGQQSIGNNPSSVKCTHGSSVSLDRRTNGLLRDFLEVFQIVTSVAIANKGTVNIGKALDAAKEATFDHYKDVWSDRTKMESVSSIFVVRGTQFILDDDIGQANGSASIAYYFEQTAVVLKKDRVTVDATKVAELSVTDKHTLVKFLKKRIPCFSLDDIYKEVKSITKMGLCCNTSIMCDRHVARNTMLYCTRCRQVNYCSRECQAARWPEHKEFCDYCVSTKDEIDSKRKS